MFQKLIVGSFLIFLGLSMILKQFGIDISLNIVIGGLLIYLGLSIVYVAYAQKKRRYTPQRHHQQDYHKKP